MTNRRMQDSDYLYDSEDDPIGLTSAFPPAKGPQSVEYDKGDEAIGLTGAFAPIPDQNEPHAWDEAGKWNNFDWNASYGDGQNEAAETPDGGAAEAPGGEAPEGDAIAGGAAEAPEAPETPDAAVAPEAAAPEAPAGEVAAAPAPIQQRASHVGAPSSGASRSSSGRGRHAAPDANLSPRMQKSRKTRRTLVLLVILVILIIAAVAVYSVRLFSNTQEEAAHQAQEQVEAPKEQDMGDKLSDDAVEAAVKLTEVPKLTSLLGQTQDAAVSAIGHGAVVTANREVNEEGNPIKTNLNVALTDEPVDSKTGSPTVYLGLDKDGKIIQVGYSASASALGFGSLSFADAVNSDHVIEKTLDKIGVEVPQGSAVLPSDKKEYSTYASDGTTVTRERCSFEGDVDVNGVACAWSAVLSYDYTTQVVTGDLSDTVRIIYVYVTEK